MSLPAHRDEILAVLQAQGRLTVAEIAARTDIDENVVTDTVNWLVRTANATEIRHGGQAAEYEIRPLR